MSRDASVLLAFGDGTYKFRLGLTELEKCQDAMNAGPAHAIKLLSSSEWRTVHVREPLRWGLIGGGLSAVEATRLLKLYVDDMPWMESVITAQAVLMACLVGSPDEPVGSQTGDTASPKDQAAKDFQMEKLPLPPSTATAS
jgi:hypothetical protein